MQNTTPDTVTFRGGEKHNRAKLTEKEAIEVIRLRLAGLSYATISKLYNVHFTTPRHIFTGRSWPHLQHIKQQKPYSFYG